MAHATTYTSTQSVDFTKLDYLLKPTTTGSDEKQHADVYQILVPIFTRLQSYDPILTGTVPIGIHTASSDLDVICDTTTARADEKDDRSSLDVFANHLVQSFGHYEGFAVVRERVGKDDSESPTEECVRANFHVEGWEIEVFGQNLPTRRQNAYLHMIVEHCILLQRDGPEIREKVLQLKRSGVKTEPAFVQVLGLDPEGKRNPFLLLLEHGRSQGYIE